jgi:hypothetical protein
MEYSHDWVQWKKTAQIRTEDGTKFERSLAHKMRANGRMTLCCVAPRNRSTIVLATDDTRKCTNCLARERMLNRGRE